MLRFHCVCNYYIFSLEHTVIGFKDFGDGHGLKFSFMVEDVHKAQYGIYLMHLREDVHRPI